MQKQEEVTKPTSLRSSGDFLIGQLPASKGYLAKQILGYKYDPSTKFWLWPKSAVLTVVEKIQFESIDNATKALYREAKRQVDELQKIMATKHFDDIYDTGFLMQHQLRCMAIAEVFDRFALFLDTGTGKTVLGLNIIANKPYRYIIVTPKSIVKTAWMEDQRDWFPDLKILPLSKNISKDYLYDLALKWAEHHHIIYDKAISKRTNRKELVELMMPYADAVIINPESLAKVAKDLLAAGFDGLIVDESTKFKNIKAKRTTFTIELADSMMSVYIMSGKPAPKNELDYFAQMRLVDRAVFGDEYYKFRYVYFQEADWMGFKYELKPSMTEVFTQRLASKSIFISKDECLDLPEKTYEIRSVELSAPTRRHYTTMLRKYFMDMESNVLTVQNKVASMAKLRQIANGYVMHEEDNEKKIERLSKEKLDELDTLLEELGDHQAIIWASFVEDIEAITELMEKRKYSYSTAYGKTKDRDEQIRQFKEAETQFMIANPSTLRYGATFVKCTYAIYFALSFDYEDYYQSHDRIYRKGQTKPCTFIFLLAENTIDEDLLKMNQDKGDAAYAIEAMVKRTMSMSAMERGF